MVIKRDCLISCRNENMLNGSSAVKRESLTLSNISCTTESQRQLFKCILRGHVKLGEKGNAFLRNVRNRIHINLLHMLKEMSPNVLYSTRLKACIQCTNFDSEGYGKVAICKNQRIYQLYRGADKSLARPGRKQARGMSGTRTISTTLRRELSSRFFFCKARRRRKFTQFWQKH